MKDMSERVAIITGASSGIGLATARMFGEAGVKTVLAARSGDKLDQIAKEIDAAGGTALACQTDVTQEDQVEKLFKTTMDKFGRVDILVNNAGIADHVPTHELTLAQWQKIVDINLTACFLCARAAFKIMMVQKRGRIINVGSVSARRPRVHTIGYASTKFGLHGMTQSLALDGREYGITCSVIDPGVADSNLGGGRTGGSTRPPELMMQASEVAEVILLMAKLPDTTNLMEGFILPIGMPFLGRG
jgi:NAD(P)-dependent dehydrogenase (short-subunit alcohol dehydrogenase family)